MTAKIASEVVSVSWAAERLGVSVGTILRYVEVGRLKGYQMGGRRGWWRISKQSILDFEKSLRVQMEQR